MINQFVDDAGYLRTHAPDHPHNNNGYMLEHRLVMERLQGIYLDPNWVVHHINFDIMDNRIDNLFLCTQNEHMSIHNRERNHSTINRHNLRRAAVRNQKIKSA